MAEDFPENKYDFKPTPAERSFAEQLLHVAGANYFFTNPVMGKEPPAGEDPKRESYKTKADIVAFVKKSVADGAAAIQSKGEKGLNSTVPYAHQETRVLDIAYGLDRAQRRTLWPARCLLPPVGPGSPGVAAEEIKLELGRAPR